VTAPATWILFTLRGEEVHIITQGSRLRCRAWRWLYRLARPAAPLCLMRG